MSNKIQTAIYIYTRDTNKYLEIANMTNIHCIRADTRENLKLLKNDTRFKLKSVPAVILLYNNEHSILYDKDLKNWFLEVKKNIESENQVQQTPVSFINEQQSEYQEPESLPPRYTSSTVLQDPSSVTISASPAQAAMAAQSIKGAHTTTIAGEIPVPTKTGIKPEGLSAAELAKQMNELREEMDAETDKNKPFL